MEREILKRGDYVLATKYSDGDPQDHWTVGLFRRVMSNQKPVRYDVTDSNWKSFRGNGFREIRKITPEQGEYMLYNARAIELSDKSVWEWLDSYDQPKSEEA